MREDETLEQFLAALRADPPPRDVMRVSPVPTEAVEDVDSEAAQLADFEAEARALAPEPEGPEATPERAAARESLRNIITTRSLGARNGRNRTRLRRLTAEPDRREVEAALRRAIETLPQDVRVLLLRTVNAHHADLASGAARQALFLPMLMLVLNRTAIFELRAASDEALRRLRVTIAARVAYDAERQYSVTGAQRQAGRPRRAPARQRLTREQRQRQHLLRQLAQTCGREFRSQRGHLESLFVELVGRFAHHEWAIRPLQEDELDHLSDVRDGWQRALVAGSPVPPGHVPMYVHYQALQLALDKAPRRRQELAARRAALRSDRERTRSDQSLSPQDQRESLETIEEQLNDVADLARELRRSVRTAPAEQRAILRRLGGPEGMEAVARHLRTSDQERESQRDASNQMLDELRELLDAHRSQQPSPPPDSSAERPEDVALSAFDQARQTSAWTLYLDALTYLETGDGLAAIEPVQDAFVTRLGRVQARRAMGIAQEFGALSYAAHGLNALDILIRAEPIPDAERIAGGPSSRAPMIRAAFPNWLELPARARARLPPGTPLRYQPVSSAIQTNDIQTSSTLQDVFGKIAYGLLRRAGQLRTRSDDIERAFDPRDDLSTLAPPYVCTPGERSFEMTRIFAGLAMDNLTVGSPFPEHFDPARRDLREALLDAAAERMGIADHRTLLVEEFDERRADPRYGVGSLIRREHRPAFWREARQVLEHGCTPPLGLVHQLWGFLFRLRSLGGAALTRAAMSVTITHVFEPSRGGRPRLIVEAYYTHLSELAVPPGANTTVARGSAIGRQGSTGNAVSPHLHLELRLSEELPRADRTITNLLPHEFFQLRDDWAVGP